MATTTVHAQLIKYAANGDQTILNLTNTGTDVSIDRSSNSNIPSGVTNAQLLANKLGAFAFMSGGLTTSHFASGVVTSSLTDTSTSHLATASAVKTLNDKITTNTNDISALNSNSIGTNMGYIYTKFTYYGDYWWVSDPIPCFRANELDIELASNILNVYNNGTEGDAGEVRTEIASSLFEIRTFKNGFYILTDNQEVANYIFSTVLPDRAWKFYYTVSEKS